MKVKAVKLGYMFNRRIKVGEIFVLKNEKAFSEGWMKRLDDDSIEKTEIKKQKKIKPVPLSQANQANESFEDDNPTGMQEVI